MVIGGFINGDNHDRQEMSTRVLLVYKDALDNLKSLKEQQWPVTKYALTASGVVFAARFRSRATNG
jgi:hypothetical protein